MIFSNICNSLITVYTTRLSKFWSMNESPSPLDHLIEKIQNGSHFLYSGPKDRDDQSPNMLLLVESIATLADLIVNADLSTRENFFRHHYFHFVKFLATSLWDAWLGETEKIRGFMITFTSSPVPPTLSFMVLCEIFAGIKSKELAMIIATLIDELMKKSSDGDSFLFLALAESYSWTSGTSAPLTPQQMSTAIVGMPRLVMNMLSTSAFHALRPNQFYQTLSEALVHCALSFNCNDKIWEAFIGKLVNVGATEIVSEVWSRFAIKTVGQTNGSEWSVEDKHCFDRHGQLISMIPISSVERICEGLILSFQKQYNAALNDELKKESILMVVSIVFGTPLISQSKLNRPNPVCAILHRCLTSGLILRRPLPSSTAILFVHVLNYVDMELSKIDIDTLERSEVHYKEKRSQLLIETIEKLAVEWYDPSFVYHTDMKKQKLVTAFLLEGLKRIKPEDFDGTSIMTLLLKGVSTRLEVSLSACRFQGMMIGEALSQHMGEPIHFDELHDSTINEVIENQELEGNADAFVDRQNNVETDIDDELLLPYDIDEPTKSIHAPMYLYHALEALRQDGDKIELDKYENALKGLESLIRRMPSDLEERVIEILRDLLYLEDRFSLEEFEELQTNAMVAVCAFHPIQSLQYLCEEFFERSTAVGNKMKILQVITLAAIELSGRKTERQSDFPGNLMCYSSLSAGHTVKSSKLQKENDTLHVSETNFETKGLRTRRWGNLARKGPTYESVPNKFRAVSAAFAYPLIQGFQATKSREELWGHSQSAVLLSRILLSLAQFLECGTAPPVPTDILNFAWTFRYSPHPEIRIAVLAVLICSIDMSTEHLGVFNALGGGSEIGKWVKHTNFGGQDGRIKDVAENLLKMTEDFTFNLP